MNYIDYEDILRRKRALGSSLASGEFNPQTASKEDRRWAQRIVGTKDDGVWGNKSNAALETYKENYDGPVKFRWAGMEGSEAAQAYSEEDTRRTEAEERLAANEQRIEELKQEYLSLQQEQETATEDLERNVAANRAGVGDTAQYNAWRGRVEAREASKQAREADADAALRQAKSRVNTALRDRLYARGDKDEAVAQQIYEDELAAYNEKARKYGRPELQPSKLSDEKAYTKGDLQDEIMKHRDKNREWDSAENLNKVIAAAYTLDEEDRIEILKDIFGNTTKEKGDANRDAYAKAVKKEAETLKDQPSGTYTLNIQGNAVDAIVKPTADGNRKQVIVDGKVVYDWEVVE